MGKRDRRGLRRGTQEEIRIRAVQQVEAGESPEAVIRALGYGRTVIGNWLARYRQGGLDALRAKPVRERFDVRLSEVSVGRLLKKLGLSPQKPLRRAYQQGPKAVEQWREKEFPRIRAFAKKEGAILFFADEAGVRSDFHAGTTWAPRGETPVVPATGARFGINLMSAISPRGESCAS